MELEVANWNLGHAFGGRYSPERQGQYLQSLPKRPVLILLQEVTRRAFRTIEQLLGQDYEVFFTLDCQDEHDSERSLHGCAVLVANRLPVLGAARLSPPELASVPDPRVRDLALFVDIGDGERGLTAASVHIPNARGRGRHERKREAIRAIAGALGKHPTRTVVGIDANGPKQDRIKVGENVYWYAGKPKDRDEHLLHDPERAEHLLRDAYRVYLDQHPSARKALARKHPDGPLAVSHRRGQSGKQRVPCRYDFVFVTPDMRPESVRYHEQTMPELSDHALVTAQLRLPD